MVRPVSSRIVAAGAVVWRPGDGAEPQVCIIHRPRHDDWSLPKGKAERGEHVFATAVREVREETGHQVTLGRPLPSARYKVGGRRKTVYFWAARANDEVPPWTATAEVDEVRFLPAGRALAALSYDDERLVLQAFLDDPRPTTPLVLLRHTLAIHRSKWGGDDALRPLSKTGRAGAQALVAPLSAIGAERVLSSDAVRCSESVRAFADARGIELELDADLSEPGHAAAPERARALIRKILTDGRPAVVCSHRPVLPFLVRAATEDSECAVPTDTLPPGGFHVLHIADNRVIAIDTHLE